MIICCQRLVKMIAYGYKRVTFLKTTLRVIYWITVADSTRYCSHILRMGTFILFSYQKQFPILFAFEFDLCKSPINYILCHSIAVAGLSLHMTCFTTRTKLMKTITSQLQTEKKLQIEFLWCCLSAQRILKNALVPRPSSPPITPHSQDLSTGSVILPYHFWTIICDTLKSRYHSK